MTSPSVKLPDEPIIVYYAPEKTTDESIDRMFSSIAELLDAHGPCYLIANTLNTNITFPEIIKAMQAHARGGPGTSADPRILEAIFVASKPLVAVLRDFLANADATGKRYVPLFSDYDEAVNYIRARIKIATEKTEQTVAGDA